MYLQSLTPVFNGEDFCCICDTTDIHSFLIQEGVNSYLLDNINKFPDNCFAIISTPEFYKSSNKIMQGNPNIRILSLPQVAFAVEGDILKYSMELINKTDLVRIFNRQKKIMDFLSDKKSYIKLFGDSGFLQVKFLDEVELKYPKKLSLNKSETVSLASYLEFNFEQPHQDDAVEFFIEKAEMAVDGMLYAVNPLPSLLDNNNIIIEKAKNLHVRFNLAKDRKVVIQNNIVTLILLDNKDIKDEIIQLTGTQRGLSITELAFGLNDLSPNILNWKYNAQINEGVSGIHVGIGDGKTGIHFDFISQNITHISAISKVTENHVNFKF